MTPLVRYVDLLTLKSYLSATFRAVAVFYLLELGTKRQIIQEVLKTCLGQSIQEWTK